MRFSRLLPILAAALALALFSGADADTSRRFLTIASGQAGGVYLPVAEAICDAVNRALAKQNYYCSAEPTPGSTYNLESLARGEADFAIVQADSQYLAVRGEGDWAGKELPQLRSVLSLHAETITLLARRDAGIVGVADLRDKRINIGSQGSGTRASWILFEQAMGFEDSDFSQLGELRADQAAGLLCEGNLDASFLVTGHPSPSIARQIKDCDLMLVPVSGPEISRLIASKPYYVSTTIPATDYGLPTDIESFGGRATLVTTSAVSPADVAAVAKAIITQTASLGALQPNLASLKPDQMIRDSLTAPLHPGAEQAFRDLGLLTEQ